MTSTQKQRIQEMRLHGAGYKKIAAALGISENTVKSYCRRNAIKEAPAVVIKSENKDKCRNCGKHLIKIPKAKPKTFCCDKCRFDWWNTNRNKVKPAPRLTCVHCGVAFSSRDRKRKYCGHACYIASRFGKVDAP